jgi:hypothetical protein
MWRQQRLEKRREILLPGLLRRPSLWDESPDAQEIQGASRSGVPTRFGQITQEAVQAIQCDF